MNSEATNKINEGTEKPLGNGDALGITSDEGTPILMDPSDLIVKMEYSNMYPMTDTDFQKLKRSIELEGQAIPVLVNQRREIIEGHRRTRAARELGRKVIVIIRSFNGPEEEKKVIHLANLTRRQMTEYARIRAVVLDEHFLREQARKRQLSGLRRGSSLPLVSNDTDGDSGRTDQIGADLAGTTLKKYRRARDLIRSKGIPEQKDLELMEGKVDLGKFLASNASLTDRQQKKIRQFNGETIVMSQKSTIIRGRFQDLPPTHIAENSLAMVIPSAIFANDAKLAKEVAIFAARVLGKEGFLALIVAPDFVGQIANAVTRAAENLKLVYTLPVFFPKKWDNRLTYGMTHSILYLIFGKEMLEKTGPDSAFSFDEPISPVINPNVRMPQMYPMLVNREAAPYLVQGLHLDQGKICDPLSGNGWLTTVLVRMGFEVIEIEPDGNRFDSLKSTVEEFMRELEEDEVT